jgi:hypothetical protein
MNLVQVLLEEHGDLKHRTRREPGDVHTAVSLEAEERAEPFFAASRRGELDQKVRDLAAGIPQTVRSAGRDLEELARAQGQPVPPQTEAKVAGHTLEPLRLASMDVRRYETAGPDEELGRHTARRSFAENDALPRHRIADCVYALVDHSI